MSFSFFQASLNIEKLSHADVHHLCQISILLSDTLFNQFMFGTNEHREHISSCFSRCFYSAFITNPIGQVLGFHGYAQVGRGLCACVGGCKSGDARACISCTCTVSVYLQCTFVRVRVCDCLLGAVVVISTARPRGIKCWISGFIQAVKQHY